MVVLARTSSGLLIVGELKGDVIENAARIDFVPTARPDHLVGTPVPYFFPLSEARVNVSLKFVEAYVPAPQQLEDVYWRFRSGIVVARNIPPPNKGGGSGTALQ